MLTALIVDDEPLARLHLRRGLEAQGVQVVGEAENVARALQLTAELRPDLLLLDIRMPGLSGLQIAAALPRLDARPLVVFVTGYSEHAAREQKALDYLEKPVAPDRLAQMLVRARAHLADQQARQEAQQRLPEPDR